MKVRAAAVRVEMIEDGVVSKTAADTGKGPTFMLVKDTRTTLRTWDRASTPAGVPTLNGKTSPLGFQIPTVGSANGGTT